LVMYTVLMLQVSAPVYRLPGLSYIQLPFRLLTFTTPLLIIVVGALAMRSVPATVRAPACLVLVAMMIGATPVVRQPPAANVDPAANSERACREQGNSAGDSLLSVGEYLPAVYRPDGTRVPTPEVMARYQKLAASANRAQVIDGTCTVSPEARRFEASTRTFPVSCAGPAVLALPISYNSYTKVEFAGKALHVSRRPDDPRIVVSLPRGGTGAITAELPTMWRLLWRLL